MTTAALQGWLALVAGLATAVLGVTKYVNYRSRRDRITSVGQAFTATVDALASQDRVRQLAAAILLRRFFDRRTEQGMGGTPYEREAVAVIAALLRGIETGELQKLLADGLAHAPSLRGADLQHCNLNGAYLGDRLRQDIDLSGADFFNADLSRASLRGVTARGTVFYHATLQKTVLEQADLSDADFRDASLSGARFKGARLAGARFGGATDLPTEIAVLLDDDGRVPTNVTTPLRPGAHA
jgi:Pentapeptide repeats (8 copies)